MTIPVSLTPPPPPLGYSRCGAQGVSMAQFFDQYLGNIQLNDVAVDWASKDLSYLEPVSN